MVSFGEDSFRRERRRSRNVGLAHSPRLEESPVPVSSTDEEEAELEVPSFSSVSSSRISVGDRTVDRSVRPVRTGPLRDLLDAEFQRCHRFDGISTFLGDLRSLLRRAVVREDEEALELEAEEFGGTLRRDRRLAE